MYFMISGAKIHVIPETGLWGKILPGLTEGAIPNGCHHTLYWTASAIGFVYQ
jgi:hypothetical protein